MGEKVYTGAYMISAPAQKGANKQAYIAETVMRRAVAAARHLRSAWFASTTRRCSERMS
jgi:hypothetical protein